MNAFNDLFHMQQVYATLFSTSNKLQGKGDEALSPLTSRQHMTMIAIAHLHKEEATLNNIARKLGTTKQSVKQIISILQKKGYVNVISSQLDKRAVNVIMTKDGEHVLRMVAEKSVFHLEQLFHRFTSEELKTLWDLLQKLYSFDGEELDGFEEKATLEPTEEDEMLENRVMKQFTRRRQQQLEGDRP